MTAPAPTPLSERPITAGEIDPIPALIAESRACDARQAVALAELPSRREGLAELLGGAVL